MSDQGTLNSSREHLSETDETNHGMPYVNSKMETKFMPSNISQSQHNEDSLIVNVTPYRCATDISFIE